MKGILSGWHVMRFIRLALGIMVIWQSALYREWAGVFIGILLVVMAVANAGCCGVPAGRPGPPMQKIDDNFTGTVYEEIESE